ncbi:helix-turn-helix domain-containing protein [Sediminicola luteus]|uniref:AraC family transcriptional regulator n=1 Tax=Sediminicola luteus TaxID=319238 RepID=A0A2A4G5W7_9FLAO|nr:AraC family transcriptional regulator [Sediminicola luteus]PCE63376.1 AraC family transcriptional regulator [Sediminicola luteus]
MKQAIRKLPIKASKSYTMYDLVAPYFDPYWHFHEEYQLVVVLEGTGTRFVGDDIKHFEAGDMVLTGSNLPHVWRNDDIYFDNQGLRTRCVVIYFSFDFLGDAFLAKEEMEGIQKLLDRAHRGLEVLGNTRDQVEGQMLEMLTQHGFEGVLSLLKILHQLSETPDLTYINKEGYLNTVTDADSKRMQRIHAYILDHFKGDIRLDEVAALANLSPTSFSRYFKSHTNKTFSEFVAELRIGLACKLLQTNDLSILQIAHECGYKTLSNFNKKFRGIVGTNPFKYRQGYRSMR